jgi:malonate-semialdehyde dehydrogenase (acetylating) / methylmalonate-semialdehyde dehydrogenase
MTGLRTIPHHIGGAATAGTGSRRGPVFDPARGVQQAEVHLATAADVDAAVATAAAAAVTWRKTSLSVR